MDATLGRTGRSQFITRSRAGSHLRVTPGPQAPAGHLARLLIKGKIKDPGLVVPLPVPGSGWLGPSWERLPLLLGMVAREEETHPEWRLGGESTEPSGKLWIARCLTGHLGEMRSWSKTGVTGEGGWHVGILFPFVSPAPYNGCWELLLSERTDVKY